MVGYSEHGWVGSIYPSTLASRYLGARSVSGVGPDGTGVRDLTSDLYGLVASAGTVYRARRLYPGANLPQPTCGAVNPMACAPLDILAVGPAVAPRVVCTWKEHDYAGAKAVPRIATASGVYFIRRGNDQSFTNDTVKNFWSFCSSSQGSLIDLTELPHADVFVATSSPSGSAFAVLDVSEGKTIRKFDGTSMTSFFTAPSSVHGLVADATTLYLTRSDGDVRHLTEKMPTSGGSAVTVAQPSDAASGWRYTVGAVDDKALYLSGFGSVGSPYIVVSVPK